ncbi:glycosyltransferase family 2 protein [Motiliproteus sp.]|uniref:glycosyltransferase family 2 protein n=1 Tax=Motiliproteus sp. TaxID=1898955 RepID=UPI003BAB0D66
MMGREPLVSVLLLSYNHEKYLGECLYSIANQSYKNIEIIIADDCSSDGSRQIVDDFVSEFSSSIPIKPIKRSENVGIINNINDAIEYVEGEVVVIHASDDFSRVDRVEKIVQAFSSNKNIKYVGSEARAVNVDGDVIGFYKNGPAGLFTCDEMCRSGHSLIVGATGAWLSCLNRDIFPLPTSLNNEDQIIPFICASKGLVFNISEALVDYRFHESLSGIWASIGIRGDEAVRHRVKELDNQILNLKFIAQSLNGYKRILLCRTVDSLSLENALLAKCWLGRIKISHRCFSLYMNDKSAGRLAKLIILIFSKRLYFWFIRRARSQKISGSI